MAAALELARGAVAVGIGAGETDGWGESNTSNVSGEVKFSIFFLKKIREMADNLLINQEAGGGTYSSEHLPAAAFVGSR